MFFIIWRGFGIIAPLILIFCAEFSLYIMPQHYADKDFSFLVIVGLLIGSIICWFVGKKMNGGEGRILIDEKTGQRILYKRSHSCFFLPVEYWSIVGVAIAIFFLIAGLMSS